MTLLSPAATVLVQVRMLVLVLVLAGADGDSSPEFWAQQNVARLDLPPQVADWTPAEVQVWAADQRFSAASLGRLRDLHVDGDILLHVELGDIKVERRPVAVN